MTPTLLSGDVLWVRLGGTARPGDVVLARFRGRPDLLVVKRAVAGNPDGSWTVASDNPRAGSDSRRLGAAEVLGVAVRVWRRGPGSAPVGPIRGRLQRVLPQRLPADPAL
jgi:phage repressor protein C with HTH and peptisase S24 domain